MTSSMDCILLAGAPDAEQLNWDDGTLSLNFGSPVRRFLGEAETVSSRGLDTTTLSNDATPTGSFSKWRGVAMPSLQKDIGTGSPDVLPQPTQFLSFHDGDDEQILEDRLRFLEHPLAVLSELQSSQIVAPEESTFLSTYSFATGTSFTTSNGETNYSSPSPTEPTNNTTIRGEITDLKHIPLATHITRLHPQTITVNLLASIISISPSRTVNLRKTNRKMDLVEILLGDETRAGFSLTFWLLPQESQSKSKPSDDLRTSLEPLRSGDVVLVQNVALSAFKGSVYGQSLSRRFARNSTVVTILLEADVKELPSFLHAKRKRVQRWTDDFVGRRREHTALRTGQQVERELPPDTQSPGKYG